MAEYKVTLYGGTNFGDMIYPKTKWSQILDIPTTFPPSSHTHPTLMPTLRDTIYKNLTLAELKALDNGFHSVHNYTIEGLPGTYYNVILNKTQVNNDAVVYAQSVMNHDVYVGAWRSGWVGWKKLALFDEIKTLFVLKGDLPTLKNGTTFTPNVSADGLISWTNDGGQNNPVSRNIKGTKGDTGPQGIQGITGNTGAKGDIGPQGPAGIGIGATDTRDKNEAPSWYYSIAPKQIYTEFKYTAVMGVSHILDGNIHCVVTTNTPWVDSSGGLPSQIARNASGSAMRIAINNTTWGDWFRVENQGEGINVIRRREKNVNLTSVLSGPSVGSVPVNTTLTQGDRLLIEVSDYAGATYNAQIIPVTVSKSGSTGTTDDDYIASWTTFNGAVFKIYSFSFSYSGSNLTFNDKKYLQGDFATTNIAWTTGYYTLHVGNVWKLAD